jgi:cyanophycinase-like exopeptidase
MTSVTVPPVLAIIGSGETAPTMTSVHAELFERAGPQARAVMLDTPFGFQENADEIAARTVAYFRNSVGHDIEVASFRDSQTATPLEYEQMCALLAQAGWVFAGPGSPTYAIRQWIGTRVPELLTEKVTSGGVVVFSSAAAVGLGEVALPVYEIYKVGAPAQWVPGLDLVRHAGLRAAVIPHYNNAEGGTHDTRFCYMGERRLRVLESSLPEGCGILGVDEHTACIIDVGGRSLTVRGRGRVTWRRHGVEQHWRAPDVVTLEEVTSAGDAPRTAVPHHDEPPAPATEPGSEREGADPFMEEVTIQREAAHAALAARDPDGVASAILAMETAVHEWSSDTLQSDQPDRAREALRELVARLAELARAGAVAPRERVAPFVDAMLTLRDRARSEGRFADADALRDALLANGVEVRDSAQGSTWGLEGVAD